MWQRKTWLPCKERIQQFKQLVPHLVSEPNYHTTKWSRLMMFMKILQMMLTNFDKSDYEVERPLQLEKIGLIKDKLGGKNMTEFIGFRPKAYSCLTDDFKEEKKAKGTKK